MGKSLSMDKPSENEQRLHRRRSDYRNNLALPEGVMA